MEEIVKHINDTNASFRTLGAGDAKNTDLFLDNEHYELFRDAGEHITVRFNKENLQKAILFIASILPRKYDNSSIHKVEPFSSAFVFDQLALLDAFFTIDGNAVEIRTQSWNARKDVEKKNGEIDNRFYFNGLLEEVSYKDYSGVDKSAKFTIRNYLAGGYSDLHIKKADDGVFDIWITNALEPKDDGKERAYEVIAPQSNSEQSQIIYYGAPGTGKSHKIKEKLARVSKENIFRTTFHPDSDYSTFVGAYKPSTDKPEEKLYNKEELISKLTELKEQGVTYAPQKFGAQYWYSLKQLTLQNKKDILAACEMSDNYTVEFDKGIAVGEELLKKSKESRIIYKFIPQAFLLAYMRAYSTTDKVYLIIEEINRGNCAQIFGDLFQLLDRDEEGVSEYRIKADADLRAYLEEELGADSDAIKDGELCLPSNLYIYATMNTSDQSLFPIDSAFKRRWDWEYEPIKYKNIDWVIDIEGSKYLWTSFQREINKRIFDATNSEDKMLGDYFVNPADGVITEKILLNKILFYLWNDVCKDGEGDIFKTNETTDISFSELHGEGGSEKLVAMMKYLGVSLENNTIEENLDIEQLDQESKTWYLNLWTDIRKSLENNDQQNLPNARDRQTYQLSVGLTGISVLANIPKTKANGFVCYYVEKQQANDIYPKLLNLKDTIENSLGELEWHREDNKYGIAKRNVELTSINDSSTRNELIEQISKLLIDFKATIIPLVDQLR